MAINTYSELLSFKEKIVSWLDGKVDKKNSDKFIIFLSYGNLNQRCKVWSTSDEEVSFIIKRIHNFIDKIYKENRKSLDLVKLDLVYNIEEITIESLKINILSQRHNNQYRKGISLDKNFNISFLEQEVYAYSIINFKKSEVRNGITFNEANYLDEEQLIKAIKKKFKIEYKLKFNNKNSIWIFDTYSCFYEDGEILELSSEGQSNGCRLVTSNKKEHFKLLIENNANYLFNQINDNGQLNYGYFAVNNNNIKNYNVVRHCTAIYSLLETFEVKRQDKYLLKIENSIKYVFENFYVIKNDVESFIIDKVNGQDVEIKLGANASAILMLTKYQEITGNKKYQIFAEKISNGILNSMHDNGNFIHVISYPDFELKDKFRIIYYDGEAVFALMRLFKINNNINILNLVEKIVDNFVINGYQKYHDHWLSYCLNELTDVKPKYEYFKLGIENYTKHFKFLTERKTVNATFLEMLMAAYKMVIRIEDKDLLIKAEIENLKNLIELRSNYQLTGYFYPEVAMYMKSPKTILHAFYSRPDWFRTRIDDQEHNLSGFISYLNHFEDYGN